MPKLITRCLSQDYQTVIDDHDYNDRGELDFTSFRDALNCASIIMPYESDPESPHRPEVGVILPEQEQPTFFYTSDYQGSFSLNADSDAQFNTEDIIDLVEGRASIEELRAKKFSSGQRINIGVKIILGSLLLLLIYFLAA